ncbi:hypothetical protein ABBQ32_001521 [Trebouxia sp. C0010 RCD-2024]
MQVSCTGRSARVALPTSADQCKHHAALPLAPCRLRCSTVAFSVSQRACWRAQAVSQQAKQRQARATYPEPETEKERSPLDYPQEWITPQPSRRPDPVPDFGKLDTPKIRPLPGDPEQPDEEEEEEEEKKKKEKEDPDKDKPDPSQDPPE